jgi:hypothetical protein
MENFALRLINSLFDTKSLFLVLICALCLLLFKFFDVLYQIWNLKKIKRNINNQIDGKFNYRKILIDTERFLTKNLVNDEIKEYEKQLSIEIKNLNIELDIIWIKNLDNYTTKSGLSKKIADIIITEIIRKITFKYWQITDILLLADTSNSNKVEIFNNLIGYANKDINRFLPLLKIDSLSEKLLFEAKEKHLERKKETSTFVGKEEILLLKELCSI